MKARLMPTLLISLALTVGTTLASRLNDADSSPEMNWFLSLLVVAAVVLGGGWLLAGARTEWRKMSTPHGVCGNCRFDACSGGEPCPRCGRPVD